MELNNQKESRNNIQNTVGVDAHIDPHFEEATLNNCRGDFNRPFFEAIAKTHGITLVTLTITIIIMLILAGVAISITTDEDDMFDMAQNTTEQWNNKVATDDQAIKDAFEKRNELLFGKTPELTLSATTGEIEEEGTLVLTASLNVTPTQSIVWSTSNNAIATVVGSGEKNATGTITGVSAGGPVTITAKYGDKTATCSVTVTEKAIALFTFEVIGTEYTAREGIDWKTWIDEEGYNYGFSYEAGYIQYYTNNYTLRLFGNLGVYIYPTDLIAETSYGLEEVEG